MLLSGMEPQLARSLPAGPQVERQLERLVTAARESYPQLPLNEDAFLGHLGSTLRSRDAIAALESVQAGDLLLASLCAEGEPGALLEFERSILPKVKTAIRRETH